MMRSVYLKTLSDKRFFVLGWTIGFATLAALMVSFYPAMHQEGTIDVLLANLPEAFKGLVGDLTNLSSFHTYLASQLFDIRMPLIVGVMSIILGLSLSVADEERGELRTVLSLPVGRTKLLLEKWLAMLTIMAGTLVGLSAGIYLTMPLVDGASLEPEVTWRLLAMTGLMMATFGTIPFAIGLASGKRGLATGISIVVVIGSFLVSTFSAAVDWLRDYEIFSLLHYFPAVDIAKEGIEASDVVVLASLTLVLLLAAYISFRRRDIA